MLPLFEEAFVLIKNLYYRLRLTLKLQVIL